MDRTAIIIESLVAVSIILTQIYFFFSTRKKINILSKFFPSSSNKSMYELISGDSYKMIKIEKEYTDGLKDLIDSINNYLRKNSGTADFSILENLVERKIDSKEVLIATNVSLPLYIGLMGTFVGIIIGLFNIAFNGGVSDENISSFIGGVVIAMIASFFGLLLTVINNSKSFKEAKAICNEGKNQFFNFLQVELLPHLGTGLTDTLERLKNNINDFNNKFEKNINLFDNKFTDNIQLLANSVDSMSENIGLIVENTTTQRDFLVELKSMGYNRMAEANIKVFTLLKETGPTFVKFINSQKKLTDSVENTARFVEIIDRTLDRVKSFEENVNNLGEQIGTSKFLGNEVLKRIDDNLNYLDKQFELLKQHEHKSSDFIKDYFEVKFKEIQSLSNFIKIEIQEALNFRIDNNPLLKLNHLEAIEEKISELNNKLNLNSEFLAVIEKMDSTNEEIKAIKTSIASLNLNATNESPKKTAPVKIQEPVKKSVEINKPKTSNEILKAGLDKQKEPNSKESVLKKIKGIFRWK